MGPCSKGLHFLRMIIKYYGIRPHHHSYRLEAQMSPTAFSVLPMINNPSCLERHKNLGKEIKVQIAHPKCKF